MSFRTAANPTPTTAWQLDPNHLLPGDVLLESGDGWKSDVIRRFDKGIYSHALMWVGNTDLIEATGGGARVISFARVLIADPAKWLLLRYPDPVIAHAAANEARNLAHKHYSTFGAINTQFQLPIRGSVTSLFCSQLVAEAYLRTGTELIKGVPAHDVTPNGLVRSSALKQLGSPGMQPIKLSAGDQVFLDRDAAYRSSAPEQEKQISQAVFAAVRHLIGGFQPPPGNLAELLQALALSHENHSALSDALLKELEKRGYFDLLAPLLKSVSNDSGPTSSSRMIIESWRSTAERYRRECQTYIQIASRNPHDLWTRFAHMHSENAAMLELAVQRAEEQGVADA